MTVIKEWADFLNEEKVIYIEYGLRSQILVLNETSEKDLKVQKEEVQKNKETLFRKILTIANVMGKKQSEFHILKEEFIKVKRDIEGSTSHLSKEISLVKSLEERREKIQSEFASASKGYEKKINDLLKIIQDEEKKYKALVDKFKEKEKVIVDVDKDKKKLAKQELEIKEKLSTLLTSVAEIEQKLQQDLKKESYSQEIINDIKKEIARVGGRIEKDKKELEKLHHGLSKTEKEYERRLEAFLGQIEEKVDLDEKEKEKIKRSIERFEEFMKKMNKVRVFINKVDNDFFELKKKTSDFEKKIKILSFVSKKSDYNRHMMDIKQQFSNINVLRDTIEEDMKNLKNILKGKQK
ncbi:MAG TPA: hypothetical protein ENN46_03840 [Candidatus Woesearchaeota archaeon]|nr:hypothetical protein [Candidatus Woesearchaeota archaeon]